MSQSQHTSPLQQPCSSSNPEAFVDMFADVSHHGSSLFEFFSLPNSAPQTTTSQPSSSPPAQPVTSLSAQTHLPAQPNTTTPDSPSKVNTTLVSFESLPSPSQKSSARLLQTHSTASLPPTSSTHTATRRRPARQSSKLQTSPPKSSAPQSTITKPPHRKRSHNTRDTKPSPGTRSIADSEDGSDASDDQTLNGSSNPNLPAPSSRKPPTNFQSSTARQSLQSVPNAESSGRPEPPVKQAHNSHTRRCRAKVNTKFQELMEILPQPSNGIKHKAQILEYTIQIFREYQARKMSLEADLALSSRAHLNSWVEGVVSRSLSLQDLLGPFLSLICTKGGWKYSEAWVSSQDTDNALVSSLSSTGISGQSRLLTATNSAIGPNSKLRLGLAVIPSLGNTDDPDLQTKLEHFRDKSRPYGCKARVDLPGRILCTMRPEWLPSLEDTEVFQRSRLATDASLAMCFGVPVFIRGYVAAVAMFFDTEKRPYDAKCVDLADYVASMLGGSFGTGAGRRAQCR